MDSTTEFYPNEDLHFITTKDGRLDFFNFNRFGFEHGLNLGMKAAYRLMRAVERGVLTTYSGEQDDQVDELFRGVIEAACKKLESSKSADNDGNRGAAIGFLESIGLMLANSARTGMWRITLTEEVRVNKKHARQEAKEACRELDEFEQLMLLPTAVDSPSGDLKDLAPAKSQAATQARKTAATA